MVKAHYRWMGIVGIAICRVAAIFSPTITVSAQSEAAGIVSDANKLLDLVKSGQFDLLSKTIQGKMNAQPGAIQKQVDPMKRMVGNSKPIYYDLIHESDYGKTFKNMKYAVYYGNRRFIYYSFYYARLEKGWELFDFSFNTNFKEIMKK